MAPPLPFTVFALGEAQLHQLHSPIGKELRSGKYYKKHSNSPEILATTLELGLPVENATGNGITLLPASTIEELLTNKRRHDLVQPFKLGLLKLASQETARLLASGQYELALPIAKDAVSQAQANLGLRRAKQCENYLGLACWLSSKFADQTTNIMSSQLHRLYGQMYSLQSRYDKALESFAADIFCCSQEYGPLDVRTSLGFYNMGKVFEAEGEHRKALANHAMVVRIWLNALSQAVLHFRPYEAAAALMSDPQGQPKLPLGTLQLIEVIDMLADVSKVTKSWDTNVAAKAALGAALAWEHIGERQQAKDSLSHAEGSACMDAAFTELLSETTKVLRDESL